MAEHEPCIGASNDWWTPPEIFKALGLTFDLDPCSPGPGHWVPAINILTKEDDGLSRDWCGLVFVNPPFGGRNGHLPWLSRFLDHGNGVAIVRAYTSSAWFHNYVVPRAETLLFPRGKTKFIRPDLTVGRAPGHGVILIGMGSTARDALHRSRLGLCVDLRKEAAGQYLPCEASISRSSASPFSSAGIMAAGGSRHPRRVGTQRDKNERAG